MRANSALFLDEALAECQPLARLLFVGMLIEANERGCVPNRPKFLKAIILPYDDTDIDVLLGGLYEAGLILATEANEGYPEISITNFEEYGK